MLYLYDFVAVCLGFVVTVAYCDCLAVFVWMFNCLIVFYGCFGVVDDGRCLYIGN